MTTAKTFVGRVTVAEGLLSGSLFEGGSTLIHQLSRGQ